MGLQLLVHAIECTPAPHIPGCLLDHMPSDVDLVVLEFGVNTPSEHTGPWEHLMRRIMRLESKPAVGQE